MGSHDSHNTCAFSNKMGHWHTGPETAPHAQDEAVEYVASTMQRLYGEQAGRKRLFLIQTYNIGKERVFLEVHSLEPSHPVYERRCLQQTGTNHETSSFENVSGMLCCAGGTALQVQALLHRAEAGHDELPGHAG